MRRALLSLRGRGSGFGPRLLGPRPAARRPGVGFRPAAWLAGDPFVKAARRPARWCGGGADDRLTLRDVAEAAALGLLSAALTLAIIAGLATAVLGPPPLVLALVGWLPW
jgi:hypothetical protein